LEIVQAGVHDQLWQRFVEKETQKINVSDPRGWTGNDRTIILNYYRKQHKAVEQSFGIHAFPGAKSDGYW